MRVMRLSLLLWGVLCLGGFARAEDVGVFVDANPSNTTGSIANPLAGSATDNLWDMRRDLTAMFPSGTAFQSLGIETPGQLVMTVTGLNAGQTYDVYIYYGAYEFTGYWQIKAGLTASPLTTFGETNGQWTGQGDAILGQRRFRALLGQVSGVTSFQVYVDSYTGSAGNSRSYFDGISYAPAGTAPQVVLPSRYVNATPANTTGNQVTGAGTATDNLWSYFFGTGQTWAFGLDFYQAFFNETPGILTTTVTGLDASRTYDVYIRFQAATANNDSKIEAGLSQDNLTVFDKNNSRDVAAGTAGYRMYEGKVGTVSGQTQVLVYVDKAENTATARAYYDALVLVNRPVSCQEAKDRGYGIVEDIAGGNCAVDLIDFGTLASQWAACTNPTGGCVTGTSPTPILEVGTATVDGDLSDWAGATWNNATGLYAGNSFDASNAKWAIRWSDAENAVYIAAQIQDTERYLVDTPDGYNWSWINMDHISVHFDPTDSDLSIAEDGYQTAQIYRIGATATPGPNPWVFVGRSNVTGTVLTKTSIVGNTINYEMKLMPYSTYYDYLYPGGIYSEIYDATKDNTTGSMTATPAGSATDNKWDLRSDLTWVDGSTAFQAIGTETPGELATTLTGLDSAKTYTVYVRFLVSDNPTVPWAVKAGLTSGSLTLYDKFNATPTGIYNGLTGTSAQKQYEASLGTVSGVTSVTVYVDHYPGTGGERTYYDSVRLAHPAAAPANVSYDLVAGDPIGVDVLFHSIDSYGGGNWLSADLTPGKSSSAANFSTFMLSPACGQNGFLAGDLDRNCVVSINDLSALAGVWLDCVDPSIGTCATPWLD